MGNQTIRQDLRQCTEKNFDDKTLDPYIAKLWTSEDTDGLTYSGISSSIVSIGDSSNNHEKQFPTQCSIETFDEANIGKPTCRLAEMETIMSAGFTSGEKKIAQLRSEGKFTHLIPGCAWASFYFVPISICLSGLQLLCCCYSLISLGLDVYRV